MKKQTNRFVAWTRFWLRRCLTAEQRNSKVRGEHRQAWRLLRSRGAIFIPFHTQPLNNKVECFVFTRSNKQWQNKTERIFVSVSSPREEVRPRSDTLPTLSFRRYSQCCWAYEFSTVSFSDGKPHKPRTRRGVCFEYPNNQPEENRNNNKQQIYKSKMAAWNNKQNKQK